MEIETCDRAASPALWDLAQGTTKKPLQRMLRTPLPAACRDPRLPAVSRSVLRHYEMPALEVLAPARASTGLKLFEQGLNAGPYLQIRLNPSRASRLRIDGLRPSRPWTSQRGKCQNNPSKTINRIFSRRRSSGVTLWIKPCPYAIKRVHQSVSPKTSFNKLEIWQQYLTYE